MWMHKWNITLVNNIYIYLEPKIWNNNTMKLFDPPKATNFA
jgi:hypothetical protein